MPEWGARNGCQKIVLSLRGAGNMRDEFDFLFEPLDAGRFACLTAGKGMRLKGNVTMPLITNQIARRLKVGGAFCFDS